MNYKTLFTIKGRILLPSKGYY